jgi:hypothetical protein
MAIAGNGSSLSEGLLPAMMSSAATHAVNGKEHQDRAITDVRRRISSGMGQKLVDVRPRWT